ARARPSPLRRGTAGPRARPAIPRAGRGGAPLSEGRGLGIAAVAVLAMAIAGALLLAAEAPARSSTLSRASGGWLGARRYLEERGTGVALIDHDLEEPIGEGVLVLAFPWQRMALEDMESALHRHLNAGGALVVAYTDAFDAGQSDVLRALALQWTTLR